MAYGGGMRTSPVGGRTARIFAAAGAGCVVTSLFLVACGSEPHGTVSSTVAGPSTTEVIADSAPTSASRGSSVLPTTPTVIYRPPFIERVEWTETEVGPSLSVFPTTSGRYTQDPTGMAAAWAEVVALDPSADTPGMQAQFDCHWRFARIIEPEKPSWNLEPGRPVVAEEDMIGARCNPGFAEEY
ncbi:Protein of unknown function [Gordonia westfalica]|uniref:DUF2599 domain-containing protein n=2 Tax=Gordonia westfalica TaxID=158898 RepID=A0A1H2K180_9ACTN|nr:Protein of unknown function [Gordonia westfalica]